MKQADRLIFNVISNYCLTFVLGVAGLVLVPVVIAKLGPAGYGLAAMLQGAFIMIQSLSDGISRALQRYMPYDLAGSAPERVNATFNSGAAGFAALGLVGALGIWVSRGIYLDAPDLADAQRAEAELSLGLVIAALILTSFLGVYRAGLEALQRYDVVSLRVGAITALRTIVLIALFATGHGSIALFVASYLVAATGIGVLCRSALLRELPPLRESAREVRSASLRTLARFSAGAMLISVGNLLGTEGFRMLVGTTLGLEEVGMLSALLAFRTMASMLVENMSNVLTPAVSTLEARGASHGLGELLVSSTKYAVVVSSLICVVPLVVASSFLVLWLGEQARPFAPVMFTILVGQILQISSASAQQVLVGLGRARVAGAAVVVRGVASLAMALLYLAASPAPTLLGATICLYAVQAAGGIAMLLLGARATASDGLALFRGALLRPLGLAALGASVTGLAAHWIGSDTWTSLAVSVALGELAFLALVAGFGVDAPERLRLQDFAARAWGRVQLR